MKTRSWFVITLAMMLVASVALASTPMVQQRTSIAVDGTQVPVHEVDEIVYMEDFEGDVGDWTQTSPDVQPIYWQIDDWFAAGGTNAWRCFDYGFGDPATGGYADDWLQFMLSPALDLSDVGSVSLTFDFSGVIEGGNWDAANVWVFYGNDPENLTKVIATPTSPVYTDTDATAYDIWFGNLLPAYPCWAGESGQAFNNAFVPASFDLSAYTSYEYVHVVFGFATDTAYNSGDNIEMYGFIVDNIEVIADGETVWADDADGNNIGGQPTYQTGAAAAGLPILPYQVEIADVGIWGPAPSPTNVIGVFSDANVAFSHYMEGPEFDLPTILPGESLWLDCMFNSDIEYLNAFPDEFVWRPEIWNPVTNGWVGAATTGNFVYVGGNGSIWEPFSTSGFTYDWDMSEYAGMEGVRLRIYFSAPSVPRTMTHHLVDNLLIDKLSLQHDLSTQLIMPYPATVGVANYGKVYLTNNSPNDESGFMAVWDYSGLAYPLVPSGPYSILADETLELSINDPSDPEHDGYWFPTTSGLVPIDAYHTLATDELPDNDNFPTEIVVWDEMYYEVGMDTRNYFGSLTVYGENEGPFVHVDPIAANETVFGAFDNYDISSLNAAVFFHSVAGGAPANCSVTFHVFEGGQAPGAEIWSGDYEFFDVSPGAVGSYDIVYDVSDQPALQDLTGSFFLQVEITDAALDGYFQPFVYRTGAYEPWQQYHFFDAEDAANGVIIETFGHHVTATLFMDPTSAEELVDAGIPSEFALGKAFPNPFNPSTTISFDVAQPGNVSLVVYNVMGQEVARIADREFQAGSFNATFNAATMSSGVYFVRMEAASFSATQKIMLMK
jgi:Secretion system C-terminal sorting domain/Immune inhibitor A-like, MAM domain